MKVTTCPNDLIVPLDQRTLFLGGGISNCPDWQSDLISRLSDIDDGLMLINPRRATFDIMNPADTTFQIEWEFHNLRAADAVLFWFPEESLCPITLYELGKMAASNKPIIVGCHFFYPRKIDVVEQLRLERPDVHVYTGMWAIEQAIREWYK